MAKSRSTETQTFDPESFDIHASSKSMRSRVWPLSKSEKLAKVHHDIRMLKGEIKVPVEKKSRSVLIALLSNILVPGLGNVYVDKTPFSISILVLSILVIFSTFSPIFPIVGLLSAAHIAQPASIEGYSAALVVPANVIVDNQSVLVGPTFSILIVPLLLSWVHLLFLFLNEGKVAWKP
jgi:hypothetical protein